MNERPFDQGHALVTSISRKVPLLRAVREALARECPGAALWGADRNPRVAGRWFVDRFRQLGGLEDASVRDLVRWGEEGLRWIIPTRDGELDRLSSWKHELAGAGIHCMVAGPRAVETCLDKLRFFEVASSLVRGRLAVPHTQAVAPQIGARCRWVVKERRGAGSIGVRLDLDAASAVVAGAEFREPIFQSYVAGFEISADLYLTGSSRALGCVLRRRDWVLFGESQVSTIVDEPELALEVMAFAERLGLAGHAVIQAVVDPAGTAHVLECNCRFGGASTLALAAGLDSFGWFFRESRGELPVVDSPVFGKPGLRLVRYPADLIVETPGAMGRKEPD